MAEKVLTGSEMLEIVYNWDESFSHSSCDSVSSSDIAIDDRAVADISRCCCTGTDRTLVWLWTYTAD